MEQETPLGQKVFGEKVVSNAHPGRGGSATGTWGFWHSSRVAYQEPHPSVALYEATDIMMGHRLQQALCPLTQHKGSATADPAAHLH